MRYGSIKRLTMAALSGLVLAGGAVPAAAAQSQTSSNSISSASQVSKANVTVGKPSTVQISSSASRYASRRKITVHIGKARNADGYIVRYSKNYDMGGAHSKKTTRRSVTIRGLSEYIYFVQVRAYRKTPDGKIYSRWTQPRAAKNTYFNTSLSNTKATALLKSVKNDNKREALQYALARDGHPYSQARRSSGYYYDCSSLAYYSYKSAGVKIGSSGYFTAASEAYRLRHKRVSKNHLKAGDLIFYRFGYNGRYKNISHVAMYAGNGYVIEAANSRVGVVYRKLYCKRSIVMAADPTK